MVLESTILINCPIFPSATHAEIRQYSSEILACFLKFSDHGGGGVQENRRQIFHDDSKERGRADGESPWSGQGNLFCIPRALKVSRLFEHPPSPPQTLSILDSGPEHCHKRIQKTHLYTSALGLLLPQLGFKQLHIWPLSSGIRSWDIVCKLLPEASLKYSL